MSSFSSSVPPNGFNDIPTRHGVSHDAMARAGIRNLTPQQARAYGMKKAGFVIPYPRFDNREPLIVEAKVYRPDGSLEGITVPYGRIRLKDPKPGQKYDQPIDSGVHAYFPPRYPTGKVKRLVVVEGEIKVISLEDNNIPAIGLGGFWGWGYKENGRKLVLPEIGAALHQGQPEVICFVGDNDTALNHQFYQSAVAFAHAVRKITSAPVLIPRWPLTMPKGVDDVRATMTAEEFQSWWQKICDLAIPVPTTAAELVQIMLEPCQAYLTELPPGEDRDKAFRRLAGCYGLSGYDHKVWLLDFARECGFDSEALGGKADELRAKAFAEMKAGDDQKAGKSAFVAPTAETTVTLPPGTSEPDTGGTATGATGGSAPSPGPDAASAKSGGMATGTPGGPVVRGLWEIAKMPIDPKQTLLGNRFLCREGTLVIVGPAGIGKSSLSLQQDTQLGLGRPAFGIAPPNPLKILGIQAENDDGDMTLITQGVFNGLNLTDDEKAVVNENVKYCTIRTKTGDEFLVEMDRLLARYRPDIVRLDPLSAYTGGDLKDPEVVQAFLRQGITSILVTYKCGAIIPHHTPKTTNRDTSTWKAYDQQYAGAGSADITNWARAIIVIEPMDEPGLFRFSVAKRKKQVGWRDDFGKPVTERYFAHAKGEDAIYWVDVDASTLPKPVAKPTILPEDLLQFVPVSAQIHKALLIQDAQQKLGIGVHKADDFITILIEKGLLAVEPVRRKGSRPAIFLKLGTGAPGGAVAAVPTTTATAINCVANDDHPQLSLTTVAA